MSADVGEPASSADPAVVDALRAARRVLVLSGAGMSAESGVPTFRDAQSGLWERFDPSSLATQEAWDDDPPFVWAWYAWRAALLRRVEPHAGHWAVADLARLRDVEVVTQNVDDLHERAGSRVLSHVHGSLLSFRCRDCATPWQGELAVPDEPVERLDPPTCPACGGDVRPGVVWFGEEMPRDAWDAAVGAVERLEVGDVVLVVGTSGLVYPAAGLPAMALGQGAVVVEVNPQPSDVSDLCHHHVRDGAATALPALVAALEQG
ncbi:SIR2 family NAD-dependent protein deacylase [Janibacter melonis]|uniref:SIR2 family NAD-dependent protein deacylase n=1 Tax=Janibacter melonis TaxID=262209 RepID=UPI001918C2C1|nr:NAD-dependent deacylase [Janibacter melonis]